MEQVWWIHSSRETRPFSVSLFPVNQEIKADVVKLRDVPKIPEFGHIVGSWLYTWEAKVYVLSSSISATSHLWIPDTMESSREAT